ncbi:MAG: aldehyde ferredoxin oxidoreductase N-terminal domain-containing protein, partial [Dehalococcoidales bacterium]|nr:aldehyde ferredoxin oxidoreductase N-terminal domain-containing protein [Dehalococcoidales bacterium]
TANTVTEKATADYKPEKYLGGVGHNAKIFWELGNPPVEAFHEDNPLIISVGPLTGTSGPFGRAVISGIAPQSYPKELFAFSGFGGKFPTELKFAGYDAIVVRGKASRPVYLSINDATAEIKDATAFWGMDTFATQTAIMTENPGASVLSIGPAGENLCRFSIALNESASAAGQGGFGAVMGSKKLKAISVKGSGGQKVANPENLLKLITDRKTAGEWLTGGAQAWGRNPLCGEPIASEMRNKYLKRVGGCHGCTYQCMGFYSMPGIGTGGQMCVEAWYGWFSGGSSEGYWDGNIMSQKLGINNYELLGVMVILGSLLSSGAASLRDLGLTSGPPYSGGAAAHHRFLDELLGGIASGKSILAQGVGRASKQLGQPAVNLYNSMWAANGYYQHHIECVGSALHWATESRDPWNSCHDYQSGFGPNASIAAHFGVPGGDWGGTKKNVYTNTEKQTAWVQNHASLKNSLPICDYASSPSTYYHPPSMDIQIFESQMLSAVTGVNYDVTRLWEAGERIWNLRRAIAVSRESRQRTDDEISSTWFQQLIGGSESLSAPLNRMDWDALKDRYYNLRGWNSTNGWPTRQKLESLGMPQVADKLEQAGRLG